MRPGLGNFIEDLMIAVRAKERLPEDMQLTLSLGDALLDPGLTVEEAGISDGAVLLATFEGDADGDLEGDAKLTVTLVQMSGEAVAKLTPRCSNLVGDLIRSICSLVGAGSGAPLMLSLDNRVLEEHMTLEEAGVYDGALLTAIRYPELFVAGAYSDGLVRLWSTETCRCERIYDSNQGAILSVDLSDDGMLMVTGCMDGTAALWSVTTGRLEQRLGGHRGAISAVACSPDGTTLATGSFDRTAQLWDLVKGVSVRKLPGHSGTVATVAYSPDGTYLATGSEDSTAKIWRIDVKDPLGEVTLHGHRAMVTSVKFAPSAEMLASASVDTTVVLWDVPTGSRLFCLAGHTRGVCSVAFSPDGAILASASQDSTTRLWSPADGACLRTLSGHSLALKVLTVNFSPGGTLLATGSEDGTIRLWNHNTGECKSVLKVDGPARLRPSVHCVAFMPGPLPY